MFFSVIIPVYNVEKYLKKCIESLLKQQYTDMEIILIDDKSTDNSLSIAKKYLEYNNVRLILKEKNTGLSDTRNTGIREAKGQYILFLDSDDYVEDGCIVKIEKIIKDAKEPDVVYFGYYEEYEDSKEQSKIYGYISEKNQLFTNENFLISELKKRNLYAPVWLGVYKRELILDNNMYFECGILHEDELWTPQILLKADMIYTSDYAYYHYLRRRGSITKTGDKTKHGIDMHYICKRLDIITGKIENPKLNKYMNNHIAMLYMKGMTEGKLYKKQKKVDRFYPLRKVCFIKDIVKAILFAVSLRLYCEINTRIKL